VCFKYRPKDGHDITTAETYPDGVPADRPVAEVEKLHNARKQLSSPSPANRPCRAAFVAGNAEPLLGERAATPVRAASSARSPSLAKRIDCGET
jgi:hypothetical protein